MQCKGQTPDKALPHVPKKAGHAGLQDIGSVFHLQPLRNIMLTAVLERPSQRQLVDSVMFVSLTHHISEPALVPHEPCTLTWDQFHIVFMHVYPNMG